MRFFFGAIAVAVVLMCTGQDTRAARRPLPAPVQRILPEPPAISADTRLLVIAPHPDDEILGAGGLMEQVHEAGGDVKVVYLTDGDGFRDGVRMEARRLSVADFRNYGRRRQAEARAALAALGLPPDSATFLSFPDQGLCKLIRTYWSDRRHAYRSPYTRLDRPPQSEILLPDTEYRGEDLTQELAMLIGAFRPTIIAVPRKEDQHPDHCAAWYFLADALGDVRRVDPEFSTDVLNYIVHFNAWPFQTDARALDPPSDLGSGMSGWIRLPLTAAEMQTKRAAVRRYRTQMHAMSWFLNGFVRSNEVFSRPASMHVLLPLKSSPCCW